MRVCLTAAQRQLDMVRGLFPRARQLRQHAAAGRHHDQRVGGPQFGKRDAFVGVVGGLYAPVHREHERDFGIAGAALRIEIEVPQLDDVVAPELEAHRLGHAERVDVEDAAAHAELRDVFHHRHAFEPDAFEMRGQLLRATHIALA